MQRVLSTLMLIVMFGLGVSAQTAPDAAELTRLLNEFLDGASRDDASMHDRFWAPDLIYTGSSGRRIGKADIMRGTRSATPRKTGDPSTAYTAEDIRIQQYGNTAIVAFRLVGTTQRDGRTEVAKYFNTGTFVKRDGRWQVVGWQATRIPRPDEKSKKEVAEAATRFHQALLKGDTRALESMIDESFIWVGQNAEQMTRQKLIDDLSTGRLKYSKSETNNVTVSMYGDSAVVRGVSSQQRSAIPGSASGDANAFTLIYTLTFVNSGDGWKAAAIHSSRS